jgi:predicted DNA-binding transcriptional regulator AlpA
MKRKRVQLIRRAELADELSVDKNTVIAWEKCGNLPSPLRLGPRTFGWTREQIDEWLASRGGKTS